LEPFILSPQDQTADEGNITVLECVTGRGAPPPILYWEKDGTKHTGGMVTEVLFGEVGQDGHEQRSSNVQIVASLESAGLYRCAAENPLTKHVIFSENARLTVEGLYHEFS